MLKTNLADHPKPLLTFAPRASICRIYGDNSMNLSIIIYKTWTVLGSKEQPCKKKRQKNKNFVLEKHQPKPHPSAKDSARSGPSKYWGVSTTPWRHRCPSNWCPAGRHTAKAREAATHTCCCEDKGLRVGGNFVSTGMCHVGWCWWVDKKV